MSRNSVALGADAAFAKPEIYDYLEARNIGYAIRLRSNQVLQREFDLPLMRSLFPSTVPETLDYRVAGSRSLELRRPALSLRHLPGGPG